MLARIGSLVLLLAAAAMLYGMQRTTPYYTDIISPIRVAGVQGKRVDTEEFAIGIVKVHLARRLVATSYGKTRTLTTSGVWVVLEGAAEARKNSVSLMSVGWLGPDGARYALSGRLSSFPGMVSNEPIEPGIPRPVLMVFEVPREALAGGAVLVGTSAMSPLRQEAEIAMEPLGVGDIGATIRLDRGSGGMPWTLEAG